MSGSPPPPALAVYFASDYGTADEFVGVVHAVLHRHAPGVPVIDLGHEVPPFDVAAGADLLLRCASVMGAGVVLAVVDPGVGSDRRAVAIAPSTDVSSAARGRASPPMSQPGQPQRGSASHRFPGPGWLVGPDNGLLVPLATALGGIAEAREIDPAWSRRQGWPAVTGTTTFDGRDLFAPAAAHLVGGGAPEALGPVVDPAHLVPVPERRRPAQTPVDGTLTAVVRWIDRFGNVQLDADAAILEGVGLGPGSEAEVAVGRTAERAGCPVSGPPGDLVRRPRPQRDRASGRLERQGGSRL